MNQFDTFVYSIGELTIVMVFLFFGVWLTCVSDYFKYFVQLLFFLVWLAFPTGVAIYVALFIHFPNHHDLKAIFTILFAGLFYVLWHLIALPEVINIIQLIIKDIKAKLYSKNKPLKVSMIELLEKFPEGTEFLNVEGVAVSLTPEFLCKAWSGDKSRPFSIGSAQRNGTAITERAFNELVTSAKNETKPNQFVKAALIRSATKFPPGTRFLDVEGVPVSLDKSWVCSAWDSPEPRPFSIKSARSNGTLISERAFKELVTKVKSNQLK